MSPIGEFKSSHNHVEAPVTPPINSYPLSFSVFAFTTFVLLVFNLGTGVPSGGIIEVVPGVSVFYGGIAQILTDHALGTFLLGWAIFTFML
ncbi:hypothetical protein BGX27_008703 [Mortierella sp. AM989]|nr:hypothetical protein BGX27_008703 [Mortierella sp. AM989]